MARVTILAAVLLAAAVNVAQAQGTSRMVSGRVFDDSSGCPLPGAKVTAGTGSKVAATDAHGRYRMANPPDSIFSLRVTLNGFEPQQVDGITAADSLARVDFSLFRAYRDGSTQVAYPKAQCHLAPRDSVR